MNASGIELLGVSLSLTASNIIGGTRGENAPGTFVIGGVDKACLR